MSQVSAYIEGILPKGPYLPCLSMAGKALLAGYHQYTRQICDVSKNIALVQQLHKNSENKHDD